METARFDDLAYRVATRSSRRGILGALASGSALTALGLRATTRPVMAETACSLDLVATVRVGPDAGQFLWAGGTQPGQIHGRLVFSAGATGSLAGASFQLDDGTSLPAVGQITGYALHARIALGDARSLMLTGVGEQPIGLCAGLVGGLLSGPQAGDLGDWQATAAGPGSAAAGGAVPAVAVPSTPTPAAAPPQGPSASNCANGLVWCGQTCVDLSSDPANCGYCGTLCGQAEWCLGGACIETDNCPAGMTSCAGECFDLSSDFGNCGACGMACALDQVCNAGACVQIDQPCLEDGQPCLDGGGCCSGQCGSRGNIWWECFTPCMEAGEPCLVDWDCCSGICNVFDYSYTCT